MKEKILNSLKEIEEKNNVKILFAVESGSREWGFASNDSDYDVRAVHFGSPKNYLGLEQPKDTIEVMIEEPKIDIVSWDIKKFASLLLKSNPTVSEWLQSKIAYIESPFRKKFREIFASDFSHFALKKHYVSLARKNYVKYVQDRPEVNLKKYVYILRGLACAEFLLKENKVPPLNYKEVIGYLPSKIVDFMEKTVKQKQASESLEGYANKTVNSFVESYFKREFEKTESKFNKEQVSNLVVKIIESYK